MLLNDPAKGSGHFPDFFVTQPCYFGDELIGYATNILHHTDVGGARPGSQAVQGITDYHQEGLFIPPIKVVEGGRPIKSVLDLIAANSRTPDDLQGDLQAQLNSLRVGELRLAAIHSECKGKVEAKAVKIKKDVLIPVKHLTSW